MSRRDFPPIHPGEVLKLDFLEPMGITPYRLAKDIGVTPSRIHAIIHGKRAITAETALKFARYFDVDAVSWMNLQARYDLDVAQDALEGTLDRIKPCKAA